MRAHAHTHTHIKDVGHQTSKYSVSGSRGLPSSAPPQSRLSLRNQSKNSPSRALWPLSSGRNLLSTAHTRRWSGRLGDLAPTRRKPAGTSMGSLEMETRRRSFPAWQKPGRNRQGSHTVLRHPKTKGLGGHRNTNNTLASGLGLDVNYI